MRLEATFLVWSPAGLDFAQRIADRGGCLLHVRRAMGYRAGYFEADIRNPGTWEKAWDRVRAFRSIKLPYGPRDCARLTWLRS